MIDFRAGEKRPPKISTLVDIFLIYFSIVFLNLEH